MTWIRALQLPKWMLHATLSLCVFVMGFLVSEIRANHNGREAEIDRVTKTVVPGHETRIVVLELRQASQEGISKRIEDQVKDTNARLEKGLDELKNGQRRQEATMAMILTRINRLN